MSSIRFSKTSKTKLYSIPLPSLKDIVNHDEYIVGIVLQFSTVCKTNSLTEFQKMGHRKILHTSTIVPLVIKLIKLIFITKQIWWLKVINKKAIEYTLYSV